MITRVFALFDSKAECYGTPFFMSNRNMAVRAFSDLAADRNTLVAKHSEDFTLFEVGSFDDATGVLAKQEPVSLGHAVMPEPMRFLGNGLVNVTEVEPKLKDCHHN